MIPLIQLTAGKFRPDFSMIGPRFLFILLVLFFSSVNGHAQSKSKRILGSFVYGSSSFNYEFTMEANDTYSFSISSISIPAEEVSNGEDSSGILLFNEFSQEVFERIFLEQMNRKYQILGAPINKMATEVFFKIKAKLDFIDDEPITAFLIMKKDYIWSLLQANSSRTYDGSLSRLLIRHNIHRVEVETDDGAIKNISVYLVDPHDATNTSPRQFLLFKNQFPISISGKFDYEKSSKINLYCFNCNGIDGLSRYIRLSDLIILDIVYENDKEDYSPSNRTFSLSPGKPITELRKERRSRLLEIAAFSDFVGLDRNEPNGLIQVEAKRKININTKYRLFARGKRGDNLSRVDLDHIDTSTKVTHYKRYTLYEVDSARIKIPKARFRSVYFNFFSYIEPKFLFSKLEETNRVLDSVKGVGKRIDAISLFQYQLASFGVKVQTFRLSFPQIKLQWNLLDAGVFWSRTRIALSSDSTGPTEALNSNYWQFGSSMVFRPDNRWGASMGFEYMKPKIWSDDYQVAKNRGLLQQQFDSWLRTGDDGKLFFRYRWTYERNNRNNNFTQIQLGYSLNLFAGNKVSSSGKND